MFGGEKSSGTVDLETSKATTKGQIDFSKYVQLLANEPSIGFYQIQDHISRSVPKVVDIKNHYSSLDEQIKTNSQIVEECSTEVKKLHQLNSISNAIKLSEDSIKKFDLRNLKKN